MSTLALAFITYLAAKPACTVPGMVDAFWPAVVKVESHYDPWAIGDDTTRRSYYLPTLDAAEAKATQLMAEGHSVGIGLSQLTASSLAEFQATFGLTIRAAMEPCANMHAGAEHYVNRALRIFNTGSPDRGESYAAKVMQSVGSQPTSPPSTPGRRLVIPIVNRHASDTEVW